MSIRSESSPYDEATPAPTFFGGRASVDNAFLALKSKLEQLCRRVANATDEKTLFRALDSLTAYLSGQGKPGPQAAEPIFDIMCGFPGDVNAVWVATVRGLSNARATMERIAAERPDPYFVFHRADHSVLAKIDTRRKPNACRGAA